MGKISDGIVKTNERIAVLGTGAFSNMWTFYVFAVWGALGVLPFFSQGFKDIVLLISSAWIQLWALPLIAVGNGVNNRAIEKRAIDDHEMLKSYIDLLKEDLKRDLVTTEELKEIKDLITTIIRNMDREDNDQ